MHEDFMHENFLFMPENILFMNEIFSCIKIFFSCMKISFSCMQISFSCMEVSFHNFMKKLPDGSGSTSLEAIMIHTDRKTNTWAELLPNGPNTFDLCPICP